VSSLLAMRAVSSANVAMVVVFLVDMSAVKSGIGERRERFLEVLLSGLERLEKSPH